MKGLGQLAGRPLLSPSLASSLTFIWCSASWHRVLSTPNTFLGGTGDGDTRLGCGMGQAESQELVHGQEQDSSGSATGTAGGHGTPATVLNIYMLAAPPCTPSLPLPLLPGLTSPFPAQLPWQLHPAQSHPSRISYFLSAFISRQSYSCRDSLMPRSPSLLLPGCPDNRLLYLIGLPGSYTLMVPSPGLGWGGMNPAHPRAGSKHHWVMQRWGLSTEGMGRAGRLQGRADCAAEVPSIAPKQVDPTRAGGTVPAPSPGQRAAAITASTGLFALSPINRAALSSGQGPAAAQSPLARQGH